jgi:hypothetical protein
MKKALKIILTIAVSILLYFGFYYLLTSTTVKNSWSLSSAFYISVLSSLLGILIGFLLVRYIQRRNLELSQTRQLETLAGLAWMGLFGWLSICGFILGGVIAEKPKNDKINLSKRKKGLDLEGLGAKEWIISILITLATLIIPIILIVFFQSNFSSPYPLSVLTISALLLSLNFFKEKKDKKNSSARTPYQKSILIIFVGLFILEIILLIFVLVSSASLPVSNSANSMGKEYANAMTSYSNQIDQSLSNAEAKISQKDYVAARSAVIEYIQVRRNMSEKLFELCDKAENSSIVLNGTPALDEMNLLCSNKELQNQCNDEESITMLSGIDYLQKTTKTQEDCYNYVNIMEANTGKCNKLQELLGNPVDEVNLSEMKNACALLPSKSNMIFN